MKIQWMGKTQEEISGSPIEIKQEIAFAIHLSQRRKSHPNERTLDDYSLRLVREVRAEHKGVTYRVFYAHVGRLLIVLHFTRGPSTDGTDLSDGDVRLLRNLMSTFP